MLKISNLVKKYGKFTAVDNLNIHIPKGHIYGFIGENGAGKTTTMKISAGILKATSGEVTLDGIDVIRKPRITRGMIGYMPDFFGVYDNLKVNEYMSFYAGIHKVYSHKKEKMIAQLLELVNLSHKKDAYVDTLSRGMKQRLCLARTLIHNPQLLILDEPASGLDPKSRIEMKNILKELKNLGKTILISSHILPELSELSTSMGIVQGGKLIVSGSVDDIMREVKISKRVKIKVLNNHDTAIRILEEQPEALRPQISSDVLFFDFEGTDEDLSGILKQLVLNNISVSAFYEEEKNIESVFLHLLKEGENHN